MEAVSPASGWLQNFLRRGDGRAELVVPVSVTDRSGAEVVHADITTWVTPAP